MLAQGLQHLLAVLCHCHAVTCPEQDTAQQLGLHRAVFNDQDLRLRAGWCGLLSHFLFLIFRLAALFSKSDCCPHHAPTPTLPRKRRRESARKREKEPNAPHPNLPPSPPSQPSPAS